MRIALLALFIAMLASCEDRVASTGNAPRAADGELPTEFVKAFVKFLETPNADISSDREAQLRFLSPALLNEVLEVQRITNEMAAAHPQDVIDLPDNNSFWMAWDPPSIVDISTVTISDATATVSTVYQWGPETNYPGASRRTDYVLLFIEGHWKLSEILAHPSEYGYSSITSLTKQLSSLRSQ